MAEEYLFYSGTTTDPREYNSADWATYFRAILGDAGGVVKDKLNELEVSAPVSGMSVNVATGAGWVYGRFVKNDDVSGNAIDNADPSLNRIDRVILRNTFATGLTISVLKGTPAASPAAPALTTTGGSVYEISLAQVLVTAGVTDISGQYSTLITDERTYATVRNARQSSLVHPAAIDLGGEKITELANGTVSSNALTKSQMDDSANYSPAPTGVCRMFGTTTLPGGWLLCNGAAVSRTTYANLYAVTGDRFGAGNGTTTFNLPDLTDRFIIGYDSTDTNFDVVGETGGAATVTLAEAELPSHIHTGLKTLNGGGARMESPLTGNVNTSSFTSASGSTGGGSAHENLPPYIKMAWGIRI